MVFYRSFYEAIVLQPKKIQADIYNAICDYALNGNEPKITGIALSIFRLAKPQIDANNERYVVGKKGGRPKKIKTDGFENNEKIKTDGFEKSIKIKTDGFENPPEKSAFKKPNVNVNVNDNVNVNVNDNVNDNENVNVNGNVNENDKTDYQLIADMYNATCVSFPRCTALSDSRKKAIKARLNKYSYADFQRLFDMAEESDFLKGSNNRDWSANFDWLIKDANMAKVLDGNYSNRAAPTRSSNIFMDIYNEEMGQEHEQS